MWTYLRIAGGVVFLAGLFLSPLKYEGARSAFKLAADRSNFESIAFFVAALGYGAMAACSTFFSKRVIDGLEHTMAVLAVAGIAFFAWQFGLVDDKGVAFSWPGAMIVAGLTLTAIGAHGRYRNRYHE